MLSGHWSVYTNFPAVLTKNKSRQVQSMMSASKQLISKLKRTNMQDFVPWMIDISTRLWQILINETLKLK